MVMALLTFFLGACPLLVKHSNRFRVLLENILYELHGVVGPVPCRLRRVIDMAPCGKEESVGPGALSKIVKLQSEMY